MERVEVLASTMGFSTIGFRECNYLVKSIHELHNLPGYILTFILAASPGIKLSRSEA
jgi:hypothetical protein